MPFRLGPGPVFGVELVAAARRWQSYALRALVVAIILAALGLVILNYHDNWFVSMNRPTMSLGDYARVGTIFVNTVLATQLALILLVGPAATAGAICIDKARGNLTLLMATDMAVSEIVLGKLFARLLPVLMLVATSLPVLFIIMLMGGVNYDQLIFGFIVMVGCAVFSCALALWLSIYVGKPQEALLLAYFVIMIWLIAFPIVGFLGILPAGVSIHKLALLNPFVLILEPGQPTFGATMFDYQVFLAVTYGLAAVFVLLGIWRLRKVVLSQENRPRQAKRQRKHRSHVRLLNRDALRWYEKHRRRPSGAGRVIWITYIALALAALAYVNFHAWINKSWNQLPTLINCAIVGLGLLLATVNAVTALADERTRGSLDILLLTPVPTKHILWAKWRAAFAVVTWLSMLPLAMCLVIYYWNKVMPRAPWMRTINDHQFEFAKFALMIVATVLANGALLTSIGLLFATWSKNLSRAVGLAITFWLSMVVVWPIASQLVLPSMFGEAQLSMLSPAIAVGRMTNCLEYFYYWDTRLHWAGEYLFILGFQIVMAVFVYILTWIIFDRKMGRISRAKPVALKDRSIWMTPVFGRGLRDVVE
jgi:ABC-type transport system involved in multi-copper enzyme maturation permease subunit